MQVLAGAWIPHQPSLSVVMMNDGWVSNGEWWELHIAPCRPRLRTIQMGIARPRVGILQNRRVDAPAASSAGRHHDTFPRLSEPPGQPTTDHSLLHLRFSGRFVLNPVRGGGRPPPTQANAPDDRSWNRRRFAVVNFQICPFCFFFPPALVSSSDSSVPRPLGSSVWEGEKGRGRGRKRA